MGPTIMDELIDIGYDVGEAFTTDEGVVIYRIEGFGLSMMGDEETLYSLLVSHPERVAEDG